MTYDQARLPAAEPQGLSKDLLGAAAVGVMRHQILAGAALGFMWGVLMRAWMRFISPDPEFSWSGTLFIVGASLVAGAGLGLARHRRLGGGIGWWRTSALALVLLGGAGAVMWPSVVLGGIAIGRWRRKAMAIVLGMGAVAAQVPIMSGVIADNPAMSLLHAGTAVGWYGVMITAEAWGFSVAFSPASRIAPVPGRLKRALIAAPLLAVAAFGAVAVGLTG
jgi:hypothetical protein